MAFNFANVILVTCPDRFAVRLDGAPPGFVPVAGGDVFGYV